MRIFYFLWDDPLFNPTEAAEFLDPDLTPPDLLIEARRKSYLDTLNTLFAAIADKDRTIDKFATELNRTKEKLREALACQVWLMKQFLPHTGPEVAEHIWIERRVNIMDPDFSFRKAIGLE